MKIIFTCDTKNKRQTPAFYDMLARVAINEGHHVSLGIAEMENGFVTSVCAEGDVDAVVYFANIARKYKQKKIFIIEDFTVRCYDLTTSQMDILGLWLVTKRVEKNYFFFDNCYYQIEKALPEGYTWNYTN